MRDWKLESLRNGKDISPFRSERKKRFTSEGTLQSLIGFSTKILVPFHFQPENLLKNCILPRDGSPLFPSERNSGNFLTVC